MKRRNRFWLAIWMIFCACEPTVTTAWRPAPYDKMLLHGTIWHDRPIGKDLELPLADSAGLRYWERFVADSLGISGAERMIPLSYALFLSKRDSRYIEVLERSLWNDGLVQAYQRGDSTYHPGAFAYSVGNDSLWVNLYLESNILLHIGQTPLELQVKTQYPWEEIVRLEMSLDAPKRFALGLRIPGFAQNQAMPGDRFRYMYHSNRKLELRVNEDLIVPQDAGGYAVIDREWQNGDVVELLLPMAVRRLESDARPGQTALERGPLVYALLATDPQQEIALSKSRQYFVSDSTQGKYRIDWLRGPVWQAHEMVEMVAAPYFQLVAENREYLNLWLPYR